MNTLGKIVFYQDKIVLEYDEGYSQTFKTTNSPKYENGTEWIVHGGVHYFLETED